MTKEELLAVVVKAADEKRAEDMVVLDLDGLTSIILTQNSKNGATMSGMAWLVFTRFRKIWA